MIRSGAMQSRSVRGNDLHSTWGEPVAMAEIGYGIRGPTGKIFINTIDDTPENVIDGFCGLSYWEEHKKRGFTLVTLKIEVQP